VERRFVFSFFYVKLFLFLQQFFFTKHFAKYFSYFFAAKVSLNIFLQNFFHTDAKVFSSKFFNFIKIFYFKFFLIKVFSSHQTIF